MPRYDKRAHWPYDRVDEGFNETAGQCPERWEDLVEAESERQLADPPATWQEHWFDHRQLLRLYHSDEHCAIYVDLALPGPPGCLLRGHGDAGAVDDGVELVGQRGGRHRDQLPGGDER